MKISRKYKSIIICGLSYIVVLLLQYFNLMNDYYIHIINMSMINVILVVSLNLINGFTGQFSIGHMGFAAIGAYISATITALILKLDPALVQNYIVFILAIFAGGLASAIMCLIIGFPSLRLKGDYLAIVTLGFGEIIRVVLNNIDYTGGPRGLLGIPKFSNFTIIFIFTVITIIVIRNIVYSTYGKAMLSIREDELASEFMGINTTKYKMLAFIIGSFFAGIAGGLFVHLLQMAHPTQFGFINMVYLLIMLYAGGMGSISGSIIAAFFLTFLSEGLRVFLGFINQVSPVPVGDEWRMALYAILLIIIMLYKTEGIMGSKEFKLFIPEREEL